VVWFGLVWYVIKTTPEVDTKLPTMPLVSCLDQKKRLANLYLVSFVDVHRSNTERSNYFFPVPRPVDLGQLYGDRELLEYALQLHPSWP
jgi:hypothetical protein